MISSKQIIFKTTTKKVTKVLAHRKFGYINNKNLDKLLKISSGLKLDKNLLKPKFCELYIKGK